ncbi:MAG: hypothetical protein DMG97_39005 [Acidobacteria bacterium]|nr:MAG: hypothetical protein DMG97_39005 [Acidobacteriota bacterium]
MGNIVPNSAPQILELTLDKVRLRANANGECFGGEIMDAMREAAAGLRVDRLEVLLTRTVLVQTMERTIQQRCSRITRIQCKYQKLSGI